MQGRQTHRERYITLGLHVSVMEVRLVHMHAGSRSRLTRTNSAAAAAGAL